MRIGPFEFPSQIWLIFLKLSDYNFLDKLVKNTEVYGPIKFEEIVIFMIKSLKSFCISKERDWHSPVYSGRLEYICLNSL